MYPHATRVCAATCSYVAVRNCQNVLATYLGQDCGSERETFINNQMEWRAVDLLHILLNLYLSEMPTELISSQDSNNRKNKKQKIEPFLSIKIIQEINVMHVISAKFLIK